MVYSFSSRRQLERMYVSLFGSLVSVSTYEPESQSYVLANPTDRGLWMLSVEIDARRHRSEDSECSRHRLAHTVTRLPCHTVTTTDTALVFRRLPSAALGSREPTIGSSFCVLVRILHTQIARSSPRGARCSQTTHKRTVVILGAANSEREMAMSPELASPQSHLQSVRRLRERTS